MKLKVRTHRKRRRALMPALKYFLRSEPYITEEQQLTNTEARELLEMLKFTTTMFAASAGLLIALLCIFSLILGGQA